MVDDTIRPQSRQTDASTSPVSTARDALIALENLSGDINMDEETPGWWSTRTACAITDARAALQDASKESGHG